MPDQPAGTDAHPTANPDGITATNYDYWPRTQEEKAAGLGVEMVQPVQIAEFEPYPTGSPPDDRQAVLDQAHTKQEQVEEKDRWAQDTANLAAGGMIAGGQPYQAPEEPQA